MFKKFMSVLLVFVMMFNATAVLAYEANESFGNNEGLRVISEDTGSMRARGVAMATEHEGFVQFSDGGFAVELETDFGIEYVNVGMLEVDLTDAEAVAAALAMDLTEGMIEDITNLRQLAIDEGLDELTITIFCQSLLSPYDLSARGSQQITFNGMPMRSTWTTATRNIRMVDIATGTNTRNIAQGLFGVGIEIVGNISTTVGLISSGVSVLQHFTNMTGTQVVSPTGGDWLQVGMGYTATRQRTYGTFMGNWLLGATTHSATVTRIDTHQNFRINNNDRFVASTVSPFRQFASPNFVSPWAVAHGNMSIRPITINETVRYRIHNTTFNFLF